MNEADSARLLAALERIADALERIDINVDEWLFGVVPPHRDPSSENEVSGFGDGTEPLPELMEDLLTALPQDAPQTFPIQELLDRQGFTLLSTESVDETTVAIDKLAMHMGTHFIHIAPLMQIIKRNMATGKPISLSLKSHSEAAIASITNMCVQMYRLHMLSSHRYERSPVKLLSITPSTSGAAQGYLSGGWLERYVLQAVLAAQAEAARRLGKPVALDCLLGVKIALPNGSKGELDLLFHVDGEVYWVEAKSGDHNGYLDKYSSLRKLLGINAERALVVLSDVSPEDAAYLSRAHKLSVLSIESFVPHVRRIIFKAVGLESATE